MSIITPPVTIGVYDLHASERPLVDPTFFRPEFAFLGSAEAYHERHESGEAIDTSHFHVRPLTRQLKRNHFWKRYSDVAALPGERFMRWKLQLPLVCRAKAFEVRLTIPPLNVDVPVRAGVLLWAFGWSS